MMFRSLFLISVGCILGSLQPAHCQFKVMLEDDLSTLDNFTDLSKLLLWGGNTEAMSSFGNSPTSDTSGFSFNALVMTDAAEPFALSYTAANSLKTHTAFDFIFPEAFDRTNDTLAVEFDVIFNSLIGNGEGSRIVVSLMHDMKPGGAQFNDAFNVDDYHPFGRPAYNFRLLPKAVTNERYGIFMLYGGGHDTKGESEVYKSVDNKWWLPGFSTGAGGVSPGTGFAYPYGVTGMYSPAVASDKAWMHFKWVITPDRLMMYRRKTSETADKEDLLYTMRTPEVGANSTETLNNFKAVFGSSFSNVPYLYNYFSKFEALRIYYRGKGPNLANLKISYTGKELVTGTAFGNESPASLGSVSVYPNPARDNLNIVFTGDSPQFSEFVLTDINGNIIRKDLLTQNHTVLNLTGLKGLYLLKIISGGSVTVKKIIVN